MEYTVVAIRLMFKLLLYKSYLLASTIK